MLKEDKGRDDKPAGRMHKKTRHSAEVAALPVDVYIGASPVPVSHSDVACVCPALEHRLQQQHQVLLCGQRAAYNVDKGQVDGIKRF